MEIWRDIQGYEGIYQVSNYGRVKSLKFGKERVLINNVHKSGHHFVDLCVNNEKKHIQVYFLVAEAFIPNPNGYDVVHHIDHNPSNNRVENLVWMSKNEHNALHNGKKVYQYTCDGTLIKEWASLAEVERELGYKNQNISACCNGKIKRYKGYVWRYDII